MKKFIALLLASVLAFSVCSCASSESPNDSSSEKETVSSSKSSNKPDASGDDDKSDDAESDAAKAEAEAAEKARQEQEAAEKAQREKEELDMAAAKNVTQAISAIGAVERDSYDAIESAFKLYNELTDDQKALVKNYGELEAALEAYNKLIAEPEYEELTVTEFETLLSELPVVITSTRYVVQDEKYKSLYPDMLQAVIQNNTTADIKNAVIAFVAWDENNLPVKIKGSIDFSGGAYIKQVNYGDINLAAGKSYGNSSGFSVDEECGIKQFKAIIVSFETFDGDNWNNPYYSAWETLYEGVKYKDDLLAKVVRVDAGFVATASPKIVDSEKEALLLAEIEEQELKVISTKYVIQDTRYKSLYPDMLQAVIHNSTAYDIKNAVVAFVAWDENNLPVKIKGSIDFSDGVYIKLVNYDDINLVPEKSYGDKSGFKVDEDCGIKDFKAIVVSYETFDGITWENPLYEDWCKLYEGNKLSSNS